MIQLSPRQIHCLEQLRQNEELIGLLRESRDQLYKQMVSTSKTEELHALRGEARAYGEMLEMIEESRAAAERLAAAR